MKIKRGKPYFTQTGQKVVIYTTARVHNVYPVVGEIEGIGVDTWTEDGHYQQYASNPRDLFEYDPSPFTGIHIDAMIFVSNVPDGPWYLRHYAGHKDGKIQCWREGEKSDTPDAIGISWDYWHEVKA